MSGGLVRRLSAIRSFGNPVSFISGPLVGDPGKQSRLKLQAEAEALRTLPLGIAAFGAAEVALGEGYTRSASELSDDKFLSAGKERVVGSFLVRAVAQIGTAELDDFCSKARAGGKSAAVLLEGNEDQAKRLAKDHPDLNLIVFSANGPATRVPIKVGKTVLASCGDKGRTVIAFRFDNGEVSNYTTIDLGPEIKDDARAARIYSRYLSRVDEARLLDDVPVRPSSPFAGSKACAPCHARDTEIWAKSGHAHALATLKKQGHSQDPDCVSCHVTGYRLKTGFLSQLATPAFGVVGCEGCHGPARAHARNPKIRLKPAGQEVCLKCHTSDQSPRFEFGPYWAKIRHGGK